MQMTAGIDPAVNAATLRDMAGAAADAGAAIVFTPEMTNLVDADRRRAGDAIVPEEHDPVLAAACETAAARGLWIHLGSIAVDVGGGRRANRGFLIDASGAVRARYDKIHLFDADVGDGTAWRESAVYDAGERAVVAASPAGPIGLTICYDLRFPDLYRALTDAGAELLSVPAAFTVPSGQAHWHVLLRARAIEAGAFVVAAAQTGRHEDGRSTYGHSLVIDPWGEVLLDMGEAPGVGVVEIDPGMVARVRARIPALRHRRGIGTPVRC